MVSSHLLPTPALTTYFLHDIARAIVFKTDPDLSLCVTPSCAFLVIPVRAEGLSVAARFQPAPASYLLFRPRSEVQRPPGSSSFFCVLASPLCPGCLSHSLACAARLKCVRPLLWILPAHLCVYSQTVSYVPHLKPPFLSVRACVLSPRC